MQSSYMHGLWK
ncbi:hypothetical protein KGM_213289A, partial [Danaus plexippus plexippus]